jgi:hypothetical protein
MVAENPILHHSDTPLLESKLLQSLPLGLSAVRVNTFSN